MNHDFKHNDIIEAFGYNLAPGRLLVVQIVSFDGTLYCWDMPKSNFGKRRKWYQAYDEMPSINIDPCRAKKIGYLEPREDYMEIIML